MRAVLFLNSIIIEHVATKRTKYFFMINLAFSMGYRAKSSIEYFLRKIWHVVRGTELKVVVLTIFL